MPLALYCVRGAYQGETFPLPDGEAITIGRDSSNTLRIRDRKLSRIHCQFEARGNRCQVSDLNSTNGTVVNGESIKAETWMTIEDEVEVGTILMRLIEISSAEAALADAEMDEASSAEAVPVHDAGMRCEECGRAISEDEVAAGRVRHVGKRFYCASCTASFQEVTAESPSPPPEPEPKPMPEPLAPGKEIAGVRILAPIGQDLIARVYKGEQTSMGRTVALKVFHVRDDDWAQRYLDAVYASGKLVHQNIALIFDTGEEDSVYYCVREYVKGESIRDKLARHAPMSMAEIYTIITQTAYALEHGAGRHLFHGSLSAARILVGDRNVVKVVGFGVPRTPPRGVSEEEYLGPALCYTPPEHLSGAATPSFATDSYSLVAIFYHLVTGRPPFTGKNVNRLKESILRSTPRPLSEFIENVPEAAQNIVTRGLAKDPDSRYQKPRELLYDLEENLRREI